MKNSFRYEHIIKEKLEHLPSPDVNDLWSRMESKLNVEMPVQQPKRPGAVWSINTSVAALFGAICIVASILVIKDVTGSADNSIANTTDVNKNTITNSQTIASKPIETSSNKKEQNSVAAQENTSSYNTVIENASNNSSIKNSNTIALNNSTLIQQQIESVNNFLVTTPAITTDKASQIENDVFGLKAGFTLEKDIVSTPFLAKSAAPVVRQNAWMKDLSVGISMNFNAPVNGQNLNFYNSSNKSGLLYDYMPSVHVQYALSKKVYAQAEVQLISPQYTAGNILYKKTTELNPDEKEEDLFKVNKLYYMNLPLTVHYKVSDNFSLGAGVQVSKLKQMVVSQEKNYFIKSGSGWKETLLSKETIVRGVPTSDEKLNAISAADSVASSFAPTDVRLVVDAGYNVNNFNIGVRYNQGMTNAYDSKVSPEAIPGNMKNSSLQVYFRYNLFGKKK